MNMLRVVTCSGLALLFLSGCAGSVTLDNNRDIDSFGPALSAEWITMDYDGEISDFREEKEHQLMVTNMAGYCSGLEFAIRSCRDAWQEYFGTKDRPQEAFCSQGPEIYTALAESFVSMHKEGNRFVGATVVEDGVIAAEPDDGTYEVGGLGLVDEAAWVGLTDFQANPWLAAAEAFDKDECRVEGDDVQDAMGHYLGTDGELELDLSGDQLSAKLDDAELIDNDADEAGDLDYEVSFSRCEIEIAEEAEYNCWVFAGGSVPILNLKDPNSDGDPATGDGE